LDLVPTIAANLPLLGLVLFRAAGIVVTAPVLGGTNIPARVKAALACLLALLLFPAARGAACAVPPAGPAYAAAMAMELSVGALMGFSATVSLLLLRVAGEVVGQQMGMAFSQVASPESGERNSPPAMLLASIGMLMFLALDCHHWLLQALATSYRAIPVGDAHWGAALAREMPRLLSDTFIRGAQMAGPLLGLLFLITVGIALLAKAVPQMNILLVGYPFKLMAGLIGFSLMFPLLWPVFGRALAGLHRHLLFLLKAL